MKKLLIIGAAAIAVYGMCFTASAEDGYIESEGDAFICLGHCAGPNTKIAVDLQMTQLRFNTYPFGSYGDKRNSSSSATNAFELYVSHGGDEIPRFSFEYSSGNTRCAHNCNYANLNERYVLSYDANAQLYSATNVTSGGTLFTQSFTDKPRMTATSTYPISLFGGCSKTFACTNDHFVGAVKMKVYGVKIWESGTLVKDFVPCLQSGVPGLRDIVNNVFVTGVDVTKVKYGGDIMEKGDAYIDIGDIPGDGANGRSLYLYPSYQVGPQTRIELDYTLLSNSMSTTPFLFSAYNGSGKNMEFWIYGGGSYATTINNVQLYKGSGSGGIGDLGIVPVKNTAGIRRTVSMNSNSVAIITAGYTNAVRTVTADKALTTKLGNMVVGARSSLTRFLPLRVYGFRLYENDALVRNYVPLVTNGVPAMIDTVNDGVLYPLVKGGNGTIRDRVAGAGGVFDEHTTEAEKDAYLEFPGTGSGIDTGYHVTPNSCIEVDFSIWNTYDVPSDNQKFVNQSSNSCVRLEAVAGNYNSLWWQYADGNGSDNCNVALSNERGQYILDGYNGKVTIKRGDNVIKDITMSTTRTKTAGDADDCLKIGQADARMRLYGLKISESGTEVRNFVPCMTNGVAGLYEKYTKTFFPLTGGTVSGKTAANEDEFVTEPQPARLMPSGSGSTATLTCFAPSAQSYEWYEDGVRMPGETSDSLTLTWSKEKAKLNKHTYDYSVKPVYTVFNEKVLGEAVTATVEYTPLGTIICIQ